MRWLCLLSTTVWSPLHLLTQNCRNSAATSTFSFQISEAQQEKLTPISPRADNTPIGWSAYGGQTLSPYQRDDLKDEDQPVSPGLEQRILC